MSASARLISTTHLSMSAPVLVTEGSHQDCIFNAWISCSWHLLAYHRFKDEDQDGLLKSVGQRWRCVCFGGKCSVCDGS